MLTIHLDLIKHKLLSKLGIYKKCMDRILSWNTISVLVHAIPDTSGIHRTETLTFCPWTYRTRPIVIPDTSSRCRTDTINSLLVIPRLALVFIYCILASQQMNFSTRELLKEQHMANMITYQVKLISYFHIFLKYAYLWVIEHKTNKVAIM